ncbi:response regulator [Spirosoma sp.]|uniref:response regulator n=1 Tax=Spirosoma sp. TaxID=1899569 RepID=UPI003B3B1FBC
MAAATTYSSTNSDRSFPILVVEDNPEHQLMIRYGLEQRFAQAKPIFVRTADQALAYLQASARKEVVSIRLVLLDIYLPKPEIGWQLLTTIRQTYPYLPVIAVSSYQAAEDVQKAYVLGVHSFIAKPMSMEQWINYFDMLRIYWLETVTLPII